MTHHFFKQNKKPLHSHNYNKPDPTAFADESDLFDCYVSVTALNLRYHSAKKITAYRLNKIARHNIYATLYRVQSARTLVLLRFLFYNIIRFLSTPKFQENRIAKPFPSSDIAVE